MSNPKKVYCNSCTVDIRLCRTIRLAKYKKMYNRLGKPELKTIKYIKIKMQMESPTTNQIKELSNHFHANWQSVRDNLEIAELASNSKYFSFNV